MAAASLASSKALFYPREGLSRIELVELVLGTRTEPDLDVVQFSDEAGGTSDRELAIALLADMDEVVVDRAELQLAARHFEQPIEGFRVTKAGGELGTVLSLDRPARLLKVVLTAPTAALTDAGGGNRLVVRSAEPKPGGGFAFGPPIFASPPFALESPLYEPVLGGLVVTLAGGRLHLTFPATVGSGWLFGLATGDEATELKPVAFDTTVHSVAIDAAATALALAVPGSDGGADTLLWSNPGALLPEAGTQLASFTPVAQKQLSAALRAAGTAAAQVTLPVPLRFTATTSGRIAITSKTLDAHYRVHPLGPEPVQAALAGGWTPLRLSLPAGRRPSRGTLRIVARHRGRALNDGSPVPPASPPSAGVRLDTARSAAAAAQFLPLPGGAAGSLLPLVSVSLPLRAVVETEVALEVRADAGGVPGAPLAPPIVRQLAVAGTRPVAGAGDPVWVSFELAAPPAVVTGAAPLWISLRLTKGELHWFSADDGRDTAVRVSTDGGATWGDVDPLLRARAAPLVQLFHELPEPLAAPALAVRVGDLQLGELRLAGPVAGNPREFASAAQALDARLLQALRGAPGAGRQAVDLLVFSRAVADLTVAEMTLDYNPGGA